MYSYLKQDQPFESVSEKEIEIFERKYNLKLPKRLKDFYQHYSGRSMDSLSFNVGNTYYTLDGFHQLFSGSMCVEHILDIYQPSGRIPSGYFPLGVSRDGDDFFYDTLQDKVYLVSLDHPQNPKLITNSLDDFFDLLEKAYFKEEIPTQKLPERLINFWNLKKQKKSNKK